MFTPIPGVYDGRTFETYARNYFSQLWGISIREQSIILAGRVPKKFDFVGSDKRVVGDAKWHKNLPTPAAKWSTISEYVWLLQKIPDAKVFLVFGNDIEVAQRYLVRFRPLTTPVEFYFLDGNGHHLL